MDLLPMVKPAVQLITRRSAATVCLTVYSVKGVRLLVVFNEGRDFCSSRTERAVPEICEIGVQGDSFIGRGSMSTLFQRKINPDCGGYHVEGISFA